MNKIASIVEGLEGIRRKMESRDLGYFLKESYGIEEGKEPKSSGVLEEGRRESTGRLAGVAKELSELAISWGNVRVKRLRGVGVEEESGSEASAKAELALLELVRKFATDTHKFRGTLQTYLNKADEFQGKIPGRDDSIDHLLGSMEMTDKLLEDLVDSMHGDLEPLFKKHKVAMVKSKGTAL